MNLYLYTDISGSLENVFAWEPTREQWWITGFDPEYQHPNPYELSTIGTVDFAGREDMYEAFNKSASTYKDELKEKIIFDENQVWLIWEN